MIASATASRGTWNTVRPVASVSETKVAPVAMEARVKWRSSGSSFVLIVTFSEVVPDPTCLLQSTRGRTAPSGEITRPASTSGSEENTGRSVSLVLLVPAAELISWRAAIEKFVGTCVVHKNFPVKL